MRRIGTLLVACILASSAWGQEQKAAEPTSHKAAEEEIRKSARDFTKAFEAGDAKALAQLFAKNADYADDAGVVLKGREQIEKAYAEQFKDKNKSRMDLKVEHVTFPSPDVALEEGTIIVHPDGPDLPTTSHYSVLHVKEDGQWKAAKVREWRASKNSLDELQWLIGTWRAKNEKGELQLEFKPNAKGTFLVCQFKIVQGEKTTSSGTQIIGEDRSTGRIRSWTFYDEGGHSESVWFHDGDRWMLETRGVVPQGATTTSLNILARVHSNEFSWRSVERTVGDEPLPDLRRVQVLRVSPAAAN